jgi:hypothetical protein
LHINLTRWHGSHRFGFTAYLAPGKTGFAQEAFTYVCDTCRFVVTRESLAVSKFVSDLAKDPKNLDDVNRFEDAVYLP